VSRVLLVQPSLQPPGGSNGVAAWVLQALVPVHRVTVLSWRPVEADPINRFFGTRLAPGDFDTIEVPAVWRALFDRLPLPATLIQLSLLMRYTRRVSRDFDVLFGVYNETDYGRRGIQYIHYPTYLRPRPDVDLRWYHGKSGLRLYYRLADAIAGFSLDRLKRNVTLVNSNWTGEHVKRFLGVTTHTLYPPVVDPAPGPAWDERRDAFLTVGRISPEKEVERVMRILARVREHHPGLTLTIVGTRDRHQPRRRAGADGVAQVRHPRHARGALRHGAGGAGAGRRHRVGAARRRTDGGRRQRAGADVRPRGRRRGEDPRGDGRRRRAGAPA
jgi:glycosyltransferase involved in cell wall biosynthesis